MVIVDSEGVRVHATIPTSLVSRWLGNIKEFKMPFNELLQAERVDETEMFGEFFAI
ncbi:hypothetical protein PIB30_098760 [Stylosanthes scabra]|uniref:Uncharacterized protein n=1 Tax=Stylosanthes scabra TaxID=79078 RepID=A0ABU6RX67_9FABA|nr:hypothetical protein [Stylosanthes scabra]